MKEKSLVGDLCDPRVVLESGWRLFQSEGI